MREERRPFFEQTIICFGHILGINVRSTGGHRLKLSASFCILTLVCTSLGWLADAPVRAESDDNPRHHGNRGNVSASDAYQRIVSILSYYQVPAEPDAQPLVNDLAGKQTAAGVAAVLPYMDLQGEFAHYSRIDRDPQGVSTLRVFRDEDAQSVVDFAVPLAATAALPPSSNSFVSHLLRARQNPAARPLAGLRIALDPGHQGSLQWDELSGKEIDGSLGHLSEGLMNLEIALILEKELGALGAQVMLTHQLPEPVTTVPWDWSESTYRPFELTELREETTEDWFLNLLAIGPPGPALESAFDSSLDRQKVFESDLHYKYFFNEADLEARGELINAFNADLALSIHLDTIDPVGDPHGVNQIGYDGTKTYVTGAYETGEFASSYDRIQFARHLLNPQAWKGSVQLASGIVQAIHAQTGVRYDPASAGDVRQVEPGVYARNLGILRRVEMPASLIECAFYNDPNEYRQLMNYSYSMQIGGQSYPYSERLVQFESAIRDGIVSFVHNYQPAQ